MKIFIIIVSSIFIFLSIIYNDNIVPPTLNTDGIVIKKGFESQRKINDLFIYEGQWWIDVYSEEDKRIGRIYLPRSVWAHTHVGDGWEHGLDDYD